MSIAACVIATTANRQFYNPVYALNLLKEAYEVCVCMCVYVCVCVRLFARASVCACVCLRVRAMCGFGSCCDYAVVRCGFVNGLSGFRFDTALCQRWPATTLRL